MESGKRLRRWIRNLICRFLNLNINTYKHPDWYSKGGGHGKKWIVGSSSKIGGVSQFRKVKETGTSGGLDSD